MEPLLLLLLIAVTVWFWADSLRAREQALRAGLAACKDLNMQMLDQTVALGGIGLGLATAGGGLRIRRRYGFEFSPDGVERRRGRILMLGTQVDSVQLDAPDGSTLLQADSDRRH